MDLLISMDSWWNGADYLCSIQKLAILAVECLRDGRPSETTRDSL
jgi:hypothetical protein